MAERYTVESWASLKDSERAIMLRRRFGIQAEIARDLGVSQVSVSNVWWCRATSARILAAILERVNK